VNYSAGTSPNGIAVGDFNADGKLDLAVANYISNDVSILLGKGDGTFQAAVNYTSGAGPNWVEVGDFNEDSKLDLVIADAASNEASLFLGNGDGTFQPAVPYAAGSQANTAVPGDFNGDGRLDLAIADHNSGAVDILLQATTVSLSPLSSDFGNLLVGTTSPAEYVTLTNTGGITLSTSSNAVTGTNATDFSQTNTCGSGLAPGAKCTISVSFAPSHTGSRTASVTISDNAVDSPQSIALSGTGVVLGPNATLSPASLSFPTQLVDTSSPAQSVTLSNYGTSTLSTKIGFTGSDSGDFSQTHTCGTSVAPGASCTISMTFKPTQRGSRTATLSIADNAPGSPQTVSLIGTGTVVELNPASLSFGPVQGNQSKTLTTTLTNTGGSTLNITGVATSGSKYFSQTNTCGSSVAPGKSCTITATFVPKTFGAFTGAVSISDNGGASPQQVPLSGTCNPR
jgi:hypothetical protein